MTTFLFNSANGTDAPAMRGFILKLLDTHSVMRQDDISRHVRQAIPRATERETAAAMCWLVTERFAFRKVEEHTGVAYFTIQKSGVGLLTKITKHAGVRV